MSSQPPSLQVPLIVGASPREHASARGEGRWGGRVAALAAVLIVLGGTLYQAHEARELCDGSFTYAAAAAYQDLAAASRLAQCGGGCEPSSAGSPLGATSSPGWTLALAGVFWLPMLLNDGDAEATAFVVTPLVLNLAAAALLVLLVGRLLRHDVRCGFCLFICLLAMAVLMPLPMLVLTGMGHTLHALVLLAMVAAALGLIERERVSVLLMLLTSLLGAAAVSLRYETLAGVVALLVWAKLRRRLMRFVLPTLIVAAAVAAVGLVLRREGGWYLPNAMLIELGRVVGGGWHGAWTWARSQAAQNLQTALLPWALVLIASGLLCLGRDHLWSHARGEREQVGWLFVFVTTGVIHLLVGPTGEHFRHSAYLVALGTVAVVRPLAAGGEAAARSTRPGAGRWTFAVVCGLPLLMAAVPAAMAAWSAPKVCRDVYGRERMIAWFVRTYFNGERVAVNEPGAAELETQAQVVDLSGLTDAEVACDRFRGNWNRATAGDKVAWTGAPVALIAGTGDPSLTPAPSDWIAVGGWHAAGESPDAPSAVRVYATRREAVKTVETALRTFTQAQLPKWLVHWLAGDPAAGSPAGTEQPVSGEMAAGYEAGLSSR